MKTTRKESVGKNLTELRQLKNMIEDPIFQKYFASPLMQKMKKLKNAYDCDSLKELAEVKGKKWGLQQFFEVSNEMEASAKFLQSTLDDLDRRS